ncbi:MAG: YgjV family protein [Lactobacillus sp.]|jgi:hypothetical protein|nr:YgjV family protein [Lactobacillus sp.]
MQFDSVYILSQVFVVIAFLLIASTYLNTNRERQLISVISGNVLFALSMGLLGGWTGVAMCIIAIARDIASKIIYANSPPQTRLKNTHLDYCLLVLWVSLLSVATYFTYDGFLSLFSYFALLAFTVSIWQKNQLLYRILGVVTRFCWGIYMFGIMNIAGVVTETLLFIIVIVGLIHYIKEQKKSLASDV